MQTPLWLSLATTAIGVLGTLVGGLGGVLWTQRRADKREQMIWSRERDRQREIWEREDALRTFDHRRLAYSNYVLMLLETAATVDEAIRSLSDSQKFNDIDAALRKTGLNELSQLELYGSTAVYKIAQEARRAIVQWYRDVVDKAPSSTQDEPPYSRQVRFDFARAKYRTVERRLVDEMRAELQAPGGALSRGRDVWAPRASGAIFRDSGESTSPHRTKSTASQL